MKHHSISRTLCLLVALLGLLHSPALALAAPPWSPQGARKLAPATVRSDQGDDQTKQVGHTWTLVDLEKLTASVAELETALTEAMEAASVLEAQDRIEELTSVEGPIDVELLLDAVAGLQVAYRVFLAHQEGILQRVDSGQAEAARQLANVDVKVARMIETGGANQTSRIERAVDQLSQCALRIKQAEDNGQDTSELRRAFEQQKAVHDVLLQVQSAVSPGKAATDVAARIKTVLESRQRDLELLEVQLEIASPIISGEIELLDIVGTALQAELDLKILGDETAFDSSDLTKWVKAIGTSRTFLAGALDRALPVASPSKAMTGPELNLSIDEYAKKAGYVAPKKPGLKPAGPGEPASSIPAVITINQ